MEKWVLGKTLCKSEFAIKDENRGQIVEIITGGKKPKQDVLE